MLKFYDLKNYPINLIGLKKVKNLVKYYQLQIKELELHTQIY